MVTSTSSEPPGSMAPSTTFIIAHCYANIDPTMTLSSVDSASSVSAAGAGAAAGSDTRYVLRTDIVRISRRLTRSYQ